MKQATKARCQSFGAPSTAPRRPSSAKVQATAARIETSTKRGCQRHIAAQPQPARIEEEGAELLSLVVQAGSRSRQVVERVPPSIDLHPSVGLDHHRMAGRQATNAR